MGKGLLQSYFCVLAILVILPACLPVEENSQEGGASSSECGYDEIFGTWKKTEGYSDGDRSPNRLEYDFQLLVVERGKRMCEAEVVNKAQNQTSNFKADYTHQISERRLEIEYTYSTIDAVRVGDRSSAEYRLGCRGLKPTLTLEYGSGLIEQYEIWAVDGSACD